MSTPNELLQLGVHLRTTMYASGLVKSHRYRFSTYTDCFIGNEAVAWLATLNGISRGEATRLLDDLLTTKCLSHIKLEHSFKDAYLFYRWASESTMQTLLLQSQHSQGTAGSQLSVSSLNDCSATLLELHKRINQRVQARKSAFTTHKKPELEAAIFCVVQQLSACDGNDSTEEREALQLRMDELQVQLHFPGDDDEWAYRGGSEGVFAGFKRIAVETFETKWHVALSANGGLQMSMDPLNISFSMEEFALVADNKKSGGIPNLQRDVLAISTKIKFRTNVMYSTLERAWTITSFSFECIEISRLEGGASLLPTSVLQWLVNQFVPSRLKQMIKDNLPPALHEFLSSPPCSSIELGGEFLSYGLPSAVLSESFKMGKSTKASEVPNTIKSDSHRAALRLLTSATVNDLFLISPRHGHILEKARRRLGLAHELKACSLWSYSSKWENLSNISKYAHELKKECTDNEYTQIVAEWKKCIASFCVEDGVTPILDFELVLQSALQLDLQPQELTVRVNKTDIAVNCNALVDFFRTFGLKTLEEQHSKQGSGNGSTKEQTQIAFGVEKIAEFHRQAHQTLRSLACLLRPSVYISLTGELLSGQQSVFDVGGEFFRASINPSIQFDVPPLDLAPSDSSISLYAVENLDGRFVVDLGVPPMDEIDEQVVSLAAPVVVDPRMQPDPLRLLDLAKAPSAILSQQVQATVGEDNVNFAYGTNPSFPNHDRLLIINMGKTEIGLRVEPKEAKLYFDKLVLEETKAAKVFEMGLTPNFSTTAATAATAATVATPVTSPSYLFNMSALPGAQLYVDVQHFHVVGSPLRLARFVSSMILNPATGNEDVGEETVEGKGSEGNAQKEHTSGEEKTIENTIEEKNGESDEKKTYNRAVESFFESLKNDLQGKHMVFQFSYDLSVAKTDDKSVFVNVKQTKTETGHPVEGEEEEGENSKPTFCFQNVYFVKYLLQTINSVAQVM